MENFLKSGEDGAPKCTFCKDWSGDSDTYLELRTTSELKHFIFSEKKSASPFLFFYRNV